MNRVLGQLGLLWVSVITLLLLALGGEVVSAFQFRLKRRGAEAFRSLAPDAFRGEGVREANRDSLWKTPWWDYLPGARLEKELSRGEKYVVQINSHGFRTQEFNEEKPANTVRVICVGGSTTVQGRTNEETYPAILGRRLRETHPTCSLEVLNFGISGTDSARWLKEPTDLFRYKPDVVVQYDAVNDIMWNALPHYAREHPWRRRLYESFLFAQILTIDLRGLDPDLSLIVANQVALERLCRLHDAEHLSGSFAAPDYASASADQRAYLDVNVADRWTSLPITLRLRRYPDYARILARYNALFEEAVAQGRLRGVMVHRALSDPTLFVDVCHMKPEGIARLAEAFLEPVSEAVRTRCTERSAEPAIH